MQTALWAAAIEQFNYVSNRDFTVDAQLPDGATNPLVGDLAPEGLVFIRASESPNRKPLLVVGNEVSGTTTIYQIDVEVSAKGNKHWSPRLKVHSDGDCKSKRKQRPSGRRFCPDE